MPAKVSIFPMVFIRRGKWRGWVAAGVAKNVLGQRTSGLEYASTGIKRWASIASEGDRFVVCSRNCAHRARRLGAACRWPTIAFRRLAHQQMDMLRHHDIADHAKSMTNCAEDGAPAFWGGTPLLG